MAEHHGERAERSPVARGRLAGREGNRAGVYVNCGLDDVSLRPLVDTGSTVSLLRWGFLGQGERGCTLPDPALNIRTVLGSYLEIRACRTELDPDGILLCAEREWYQWYTGDCRVTQTNSTHTVCSCNQLKTLALFMLTIPCKNNITALCAKNFLDLIVHNINQDLPEELVKRYLNITLNLMNDVKKNVSDGNDLMSFGDKVLNVTRQLVSTLMGKGDTNFTLQDLEVQVAVGRSNIMMFTDSASLDINFSGISGNNLG
ncbi:uncharacterized protein LOC128507008 [Clarias gariepinus]|uniref:uncharacterized protein LOC128507008 n=1 Tax=Clarias gariepinus TaxID=13013 RepID=UPI00234C264F|nr:uncharacterized protein LOC128507008 [Clarias gariepinus]